MRATVNIAGDPGTSITLPLHTPRTIVVPAGMSRQLSCLRTRAARVGESGSDGNGRCQVLLTYGVRVVCAGYQETAKMIGESGEFSRDRIGGFGLRHSVAMTDVALLSV